MSVEKYRCNVDKKANKVSSIPRSILLYESIVDIDISKVSSIISTSISILTTLLSTNQLWVRGTVSVLSVDKCRGRRPYAETRCSNYLPNWFWRLQQRCSVDTPCIDDYRLRLDLVKAANLAFRTTQHRKKQ